MGADTHQLPLTTGISLGIAKSRCLLKVLISDGGLFEKLGHEAHLGPIKPFKSPSQTIFRESADSGKNHAATPFPLRATLMARRTSSGHSTTLAESSLMTSMRPAGSSVPHCFHMVVEKLPTLALRVR